MVIFNDGVGVIFIITLYEARLRVMPHKLSIFKGAIPQIIL